MKNLITNRYYYQDASGSTSHLADSSGHLLEWYRYDLQGTPVFYNSSDSQLPSSSYGIRHLFTGQQWYNELGLYDLRNRFYSPDIGRFLQGDPIGFNGDATNLYRYCGNNPLTWQDPMGLNINQTQIKSDDRVVVNGNDPFGANTPWGELSLSPRDAFALLGVIGGGGLESLTGGEARGWGGPFSLGPPVSGPPAISPNPFGSGGSQFDIGIVPGPPVNTLTIDYAAMNGLPTQDEILGYQPPPLTVWVGLNLSIIPVQDFIALSGGYYANNTGVGKFTGGASNGGGWDNGVSATIGMNAGPINGGFSNYNFGGEGYVISVHLNSQGQFTGVSMGPALSLGPTFSITNTDTQLHGLFWPIIGD